MLMVEMTMVKDDWQMFGELFVDHNDEFWTSETATEFHRTQKHEHATKDNCHTGDIE